MVIIISYCIELSILSMESKRRNPCAVVRVSGDLDPNLPLSVEFFFAAPAIRGGFFLKYRFFAVPLHLLSSIGLNYGVMVTQQILVLSFLVRVQVVQHCRS